MGCIGREYKPSIHYSIKYILLHMLQDTHFRYYLFNILYDNYQLPLPNSFFITLALATMPNAHMYAEVGTGSDNSCHILQGPHI